jgi:hypothetical protein
MKTDGPVAHPLPPGCRLAPCNMYIPGFNDGHHTATVYVCDQLPTQAASQPLVQTTGTCTATWHSQWLPPPVARSAGTAAGTAGDE